MAQNDIYQVTDVQVMDTRGLANVYYFKVMNDDTAVSQPDNLKDMFIATYIPAIKALQSDQLNHDSLIIKRVDPVKTVGEIYDVSQVGTKLTAPLPNSQTVLVSHVSLPNNKQNRGRMFYAGVVNADEQNGRLLHTPWQAWGAIPVLFPQTHTQAAIQYRQVHYNRKDNQFNEITAAEAKPVLSKLARRIPRRTPIS